MKKLLTLSLALALSGLVSQPLLAKSKDNDDKKKGEKSSKSEKKDTQRSAVVASQRLRSPASQSRNVVQLPAATSQLNGRGTQNAAIYETRTRQESSRNSYQDRSRDDNRYSNNNDDRGWSQYRYYRAPSSAYGGWDRSRSYSWNSHRYHWYDGSWIIINPGYDYAGYRSSTVSFSSGSEVRDVQVLLTRRGYAPGPIDGDMGYRTRRAIEHFQADRGLAVTGRIDRTLRIALDRG